MQLKVESMAEGKRRGKQMREIRSTESNEMNEIIQ